MKILARAAIICIFTALGISGYSHGKEIYRWVDEKGVVHYSDTIPKQASEKDMNLEGRLGKESESEQTDAQDKQKEIEEHNARVRERNKAIKKGYEKAAREAESGTTAEKIEKSPRDRDIEALRAEIKESKRIRAMNEKEIKEYEERKNEIEKQNEGVGKHNEKVMEENNKLKKEYETELEKLEKEKAEGKIEEGSERDKKIGKYREIIKKIEEDEAWAKKKNQEIQMQNKKMAEEFEAKKKEILSQNARLKQIEEENLKRLESLKRQ